MGEPVGRRFFAAPPNPPAVIFLFSPSGSFPPGFAIWPIEPARVGHVRRVHAFFSVSLCAPSRTDEPQPGLRMVALASPFLRLGSRNSPPFAPFFSTSDVVGGPPSVQGCAIFRTVFVRRLVWMRFLYECWIMKCYDWILNLMCIKILCRITKRYFKGTLENFQVIEVMLLKWHLLNFLSII